jgi:hypothetical protein
VVAKIHALTGDRNAQKRNQLCVKVTLLAAQLKAEKDLSSALAHACAELAAQNEAMKEQYEHAKLGLQLRVEHLEKQLQKRKPMQLIRT